MHDGKHLDPLQGARSSRTRILKRRTLYRRMRRSGSRLVRNAMGLARVSCARTFDTRVLEARIAGALSLNSFGETLDSVTFGRRLRTRSSCAPCGSRCMRIETTARSFKLVPCFRMWGRSHASRGVPMKQRVLGHSRKHARGTETFERVCPRSVSLLQKSIDDVVLEG
jgi:hypothetical protein